MVYFPGSMNSCRVTGLTCDLLKGVGEVGGVDN